jgi:hypothetical protein
MIVTPPAALTAMCERPVRLPDGDLTQGAAVTLWAKDRAELVACGDEKEALVQWTENTINAVNFGDHQ